MICFGVMALTVGPPRKECGKGFFRNGQRDGGNAVFQLRAGDYLCQGALQIPDIGILLGGDIVEHGIVYFQVAADDLLI